MRRDSKGNTANNTISVLGIIQVGLVLLKVVGKSNLSWIKTFIPLYIELAIVVVVFLVFFIQSYRANVELRKYKIKKNEMLAEERWKKYLEEKRSKRTGKYIFEKLAEKDFMKNTGR
ncbi:MAG: hypothetical protein SPG13_00945 [Peptostreptococcus porci]|uniref:Uncharacterized protein n=1 Tax=Peptostreptococcus porci TaxID=2652282 RepID=A0A6N7XFB9_9FIRM|nr:hypothetical protein [Peptostreptococcus porci]MDY5479005.1 hypothetical protein [Peptostreptococcus porci]MST63072.1 hypothetical protein [Peptostreptococcus porci]